MSYTRSVRQNQLFHARISPSPSSTLTALVTHTQGDPCAAPGYCMQSHEVIDEVLLNEPGDRQSMTSYILPPLPQAPTSFNKPCDVLTGLTGGATVLSVFFAFIKTLFGCIL